MEFIQLTKELVFWEKISVLVSKLNILTSRKTTIENMEELMGVREVTEVLVTGMDMDRLEMIDSGREITEDRTTEETMVLVAIPGPRLAGIRTTSSTATTATNTGGEDGANQTMEGIPCLTW